MINKYKKNLKDLIKSSSDQDFTQFQNSEGSSVSFDDLVWYYISSKKRTTRILCCRHDGKNRCIDSQLTEDLALPKVLAHLLKAYIIHCISDEVSIGYKSSLIISARFLLSNLVSDLYELTESHLTHICKLQHPEHIFAFIRFCMEQKLIRANLTLKYRATRDRFGENEYNKSIDKLPTESTITALGTIYKEVFKNVNDDGTVMNGQKVDISDAFIIAMTCLSIGSPNRAKAEQIVLKTQRLGKIERDGVTVHSLEYSGSKGYKDNNKHILTCMAKPIDKCLAFFSEYGKLGRILTSFYADSTQTLKKLTKNIIIEKTRLNNLKIDSIPNLFQLGYSLGFYEQNATVKIANEELKSMLLNGFSIYYCQSDNLNKTNSIYYLRATMMVITRRICDLTDDDLIYCGQGSTNKPNNFKSLFGFCFNNINKIINNGYHSVADLQNIWCKYYKTQCVPEFPLSYTPSENSVDLRYALFALLGKEFGGGGDVGSFSHYYVLTAKRLAAYFNNRLKKNSANSIFSKYGFSAELGIPSHSLRHYCNTLADMSNIPISIITAWSGRVNSQQTHTYIHSGDEFKSERVSEITSSKIDKSISIRVTSIKSLSESSALHASETSTGICTQNLNVTPCSYLNDFMSQCFLCSEACHIGGDEKAIALFQKDYLYQKRRLDKVNNDQRLSASKAMQQWFKIHYFNTEILQQLIKLMQDEQQGNIIIYTKQDEEFKITDLNTGKINCVKALLPDVDKELKAILDKNKSENLTFNENDNLSNLALSFGISLKDI